MRIAIRPIRTFVLLTLVVLACSGARPATAAPKTFIALLNGGQETPPNTSPAFGVAFLTFDGTKLCYSITYSNLSSRELFAHFHGPATPGNAADPLFTLLETGSPKNGCWNTLDKMAKKALMKGQLYLNVHTNDFQAGEIRGQVLHTK